MLFKNETGRNKKIRLDKSDEPGGYLWHTVREGDLIDIPKHIGLGNNFTLVQEEIINANGEIKKGKSKVDKSHAIKGVTESKKVEVVDTLKKKANYFKKLKSIDGIGPKTAEDIVEVYQEEVELIKAIKDHKELPFRDDIADKLIEAFDHD